MHIYSICVCICIHIDTFIYRHMPMPLYCMYVYTHVHREVITLNLAMLSFETNRFKATCFKSSGFVLTLILRKLQCSISALHKCFNRSRRVRPILWKMKWQRFYNS